MVEGSNRIDDSTDEQNLSVATEAFSLLADETRLKILLELANSDSMAWSGATNGLAFGELREAVGVSDPGRFNYHLGKLCDTFVRKTDDGYVLRYAGYRVTADIASGVYHESVPPMRAETDIACLHDDCSRFMETIYEDSYVRLSCPEPDHETTFQTPLPPNAAIDRDAHSLLDIATRDARHMTEHARAGTCPVCWGNMETTVPIDIGTESSTDHVIAASASCTDCSFELTTPVAVFAGTHAAVTSAYGTPDPAFNDRSLLDYPYIRQPDATTLRSEDPIRIAVDTDPDDEHGSPTLVFGQDLSVVDVEPAD